MTQAEYLRMHHAEPVATTDPPSLWALTIIASDARFLKRQVELDHAEAIQEDAERWAAEGERLLQAEIKLFASMGLLAPEWDEIGGSGVEPLVFGGWEDAPTRVEVVVDDTARTYQALIRTWHWLPGAPRMLAAPHCFPS